jgi:UPF0755 protein
MKKKPLIIALIILIALLLIAGIVLLALMPKIKSYIAYQNDMNGKKQADIPYTLVIEKEDFEDSVALELEENDIIVSAVRFLNYIKAEYPEFVCYNGIYELNANMSYQEICETLLNPENPIEYVKFVVPEGKTVKDIANIVAKSGLCTKEEFLEAADSYDYDYSFVAELKARNQKLIGYKLEGYLFPATYEFRADTATATVIVDNMLQTFSQYVTKDMIDQAEEMGLSLNEFVSLASVIQAEAFSVESMSGVSSVFWNRLKSSAYPRLQSDPTKKYAMALSDLKHFNSKMEDAYDTYTCKDLPVGPTNCPGIDAMKAVLAPDSSEYYYFVTDKEGKFYFNKTLSDHNKTVSTLKRKGLWAYDSFN